MIPPLPTHTHTMLRTSTAPHFPPPGQKALSAPVKDKQSEGMWAERLANTELHRSIAGQTEAVVQLSSIHGYIVDGFLATRKSRSIRKMKHYRTMVKHVIQYKLKTHCITRLFSVVLLKKEVNLPFLFRFKCIYFLQVAMRRGYWTPTL